jgi:hypothetical protein
MNTGILHRVSDRESKLPGTSVGTNTTSTTSRATQRSVLESLVGMQS